MALAQKSCVVSLSFCPNNQQQNKTGASRAKNSFSFSSFVFFFFIIIFIVSLCMSDNKTRIILKKTSKLIRRTKPINQSQKPGAQMDVELLLRNFCPFKSQRAKVFLFAVVVVATANKLHDTTKI